MKLASTSFPARLLVAAGFAVLSILAWAAKAQADPPARTHNYLAQVAVGTRPDDRAGIRGANGPSFLTPAQAIPVRPDDRAGIRGIDSTTVAATEVSLGGGSAFDWADAGVGAGSTLALVLIAGGLVVARGRFRAPAHA